MPALNKSLDNVGAFFGRPVLAESTETIGSNPQATLEKIEAIPHEIRALLSTVSTAQTRVRLK
jgi:hypothetical protein